MKSLQIQRSNSNRRNKTRAFAKFRRFIAKEVTQIRIYGTTPTGYCVCPGCNCTFEREYQNYCDRCGQKLAWNDFSKGKITLIKRVPYTIKPKDKKERQEESYEAVTL